MSRNTLRSLRCRLANYWSNRLWSWLIDWTWLWFWFKIHWLTSKEFFTRNRTLSNHIYLAHHANVFYQTNHVGKHWVTDTHLVWHVAINSGSENFWSQLHHTWHNRSTTDKNNPSWHVQEASTFHICFDTVYGV